MAEEFISEADHLIAALTRRKQQWLWRDGSADTQTRGGYIEGVNDAIKVIEEFYEAKRRYSYE